MMLQYIGQSITSKEDFDKFLSQADKRMYEQKNKKKRKV